MPEDPIRHAFDVLDRPVAPEPEFRESLFDRLVEESKRRPKLVPPRQLVRRRPELRRALTIAAVLGLATLILAIVLVPLRGLMGHGQLASGITPTTPFRATIEGTFPSSPASDGGGDFWITISYQGPDAWRIDLLGGSGAFQPLVNDRSISPGSYVIWDGKGLTAYDGAKKQFVPQPLHAAWFSPLNLLGYFDAKSGWKQACAAGEDLGDEVIAGRPVHHLRCAAPAGAGYFGQSVDMWVDVDSGLILKLVSGQTAGTGFPPGPIAWYPGEKIEVTSVEYAPTFGPDEFGVSPHPTPSEEPAPVTTLAIGQEVPTFTGTTKDGEPFDLSSLRGKPTVVYLWAQWCGPCTSFPLDVLDQAFSSRTDLNVVTVGFRDDPSSLGSFVQQHGLGFPVVFPDSAGDASIQQDWGLQGIPTLVLIDARGRFLGAYVGWSAEIGRASDVTAILDALASGSPLPEERAFESEQIA
ncbi:MAG: redoxin family protein [Actinobacteria bacterium]|nr:redoxin family protein [Actinomycetota bacterium]